MTLSDFFDNEDSFYLKGWLRSYDNDITSGLTPLEAFADQLTDEAADQLQQLVVDAKKDGFTTDAQINTWVESYITEYREKHTLPADLQPGPNDKVIAVVYGSPVDVHDVAEGVAVGQSLEEDEDESDENEEEDEQEGFSPEKILTVSEALQDINPHTPFQRLEAGYAHLLNTANTEILHKPEAVEDTLAEEVSEILAMNEQEFDIVQKARHYNLHPSGVECIDIVDQMPFCSGSAVKYVWRRGDKGNEKQDLEKALYYVNREFERVTQLLKFVPLHVLRKYSSNNTFTQNVADLCERVVEEETNATVSAFYSHMFKQCELRQYKQELRSAKNCIEDLLANLQEEEK